MTITDYRKLLNTRFCDNKQTMLVSYISEILDIASKMNYENILQKLNQIMSEHAQIKHAYLTDDEKVTYIIIEDSPLAREKILNLKFHTQNQLECDFSEKILNLGR